MPLPRCAAASLLALALCVPPSRAGAADAGRGRGPVRLIPAEADLLVEVRQPRRLVEELSGLPSWKQLQQLAPVRELLDSTNSRRFFQLVAYLEKELGAPWPQLLDRLAGRGIALGVKLGPDPAPALLVLDGADEELTRRFFRLGVGILEQELARQEAREKPVKGTYEGVETVRVGKDFHAAAAGTALLLANSETALRAGLDLHLGRGKKSLADSAAVRQAEDLLPGRPLASLWLNLETVRKSPGIKAAYRAAPRDDPGQTLFFGHYLDVLGRSPFLCAGLYREADGFVATVRMPRGRDGMGADRLLHVPPDGAPGSRPLLEPRNVLYSESSYFAIANVWNERAKLFNEKQAADLEKADKQSPGPLRLLGVTPGKLLPLMGPYYRFVAAHQERGGYKTTPKISIPAFALVWELREPEAFARSADGALRAAALFAGSQAGLKLAEEQYQGCKLVGYRFPEDKPLKGDVNDLRFNFSPCFTRVGDQYVVASTVELCRELVDLLRKEGTDPKRGDPATARSRVYAAGVAAYLTTVEDLLATGGALDQAVTPKEARRQVKAFLDILRHLRTLSLEPHFDDKMFRYDIRAGR